MTNEAGTGEVPVQPQVATHAHGGGKNDFSILVCCWMNNRISQTFAARFAIISLESTMRGGLGLVEHDRVGRVGAGSVASKTTDAADAAASRSVRSESAVIRNSKSILQTETETVTSESCADHASIRVKHNGAYLSAATTTSTAGGSVERRDDDDSSARLATSKSFRSRHSLSPTSPPPDQVEIAGVVSGLSLLGFNDYESEESIISPHDCETNNRHLIIHKAASLVSARDEPWDDVDTEMGKMEAVTSLYQSKKSTNAPSKQVSSTPGVAIGVKIQSGYTEHHCNVSTSRGASCSLGMLREFLGTAPPIDNKTSPFQQSLVSCAILEPRWSPCSHMSQSEERALQPFRELRASRPEYQCVLELLVEQLVERRLHELQLERWTLEPLYVEQRVGLQRAVDEQREWWRVERRGGLEGRAEQPGRRGVRVVNDGGS